MDLSPFFARPARRSRAATAKTPAQVSRRVCAEPPAATDRHGAGHREHRQAERLAC